MVFITTELEIQPQLIAFLKEKGIMIGGYGQLRLVTHHDIEAADIPRVIAAFKAAMESCNL